MTITNFCTQPRTMAEIVGEGYTKDMVYNAVKKGALVNLNRKDSWGRIRRGKGLFQIANESERVNKTPFVTGCLIGIWTSKEKGR